MAASKTKPTGRNTDYEESLAEDICARLVEGESLRSICRDPDYPALSTVFLWLTDVTKLLAGKPFSEQYAKARQFQAEAMADELIDISDDAQNDWMERHGKDAEGYQLNGEHVTRSRLRIDTRKWVAERMAAKKYGSKQEIDHKSSDGSFKTPTRIEIVAPSNDSKAD